MNNAIFLEKENNQMHYWLMKSESDVWSNDQQKTNTKLSFNKCYLNFGPDIHNAKVLLVPEINLFTL